MTYVPTQGPPMLMNIRNGCAVCYYRMTIYTSKSDKAEAVIALPCSNRMTVGLPQATDARRRLNTASKSHQDQAATNLFHNRFRFP